MNTFTCPPSLRPRNQALPPQRRPRTRSVESSRIQIVKRATSSTMPSCSSGSWSITQERPSRATSMPNSSR
ncbi:hypothetical protein EMPG_13715 [Blastomyces silverae]|uniref:Uncharacterized protein n=1 Tax=Blastomyces silverae TaxID=2060906 RepID=A0A0H1BIR1_9EURO|nr:hypothetical protein EMPG_13715 [Blastomyces silverae]